MIKKILTDPDHVLRQKAKELTDQEINNEKLKNLIKDLAETMDADNGVGIAAPQIGESIRLCLITKKFNPLGKKDLVLINPKWTKTTMKTAWDEEGCLSVPDTYGKVKRYVKIKVEAKDENGNPIAFPAEKFFARIIQHEIDHLDGILFTDKAKNVYQISKF